LKVGIERIAAQGAEIERELNAADAKLGDGDTGVMLRRVFQKLSEASAGIPSDMSGALRAYALASSAATGSSLGTLITTALLTAAKATEGKAELGWNDLAGIISAALEAMMKRGGAKLGDKTILDTFAAVGQAVSGLSGASSIRATILRASREALDAYRARPCRIGRARMFAEKSVGLDDPGMLAFVRVMEAALGERPLPSGNRTYSTIVASASIRP
jgi:dihydroxyacetone kinase